MAAGVKKSLTLINSGLFHYLEAAAVSAEARQDTAGPDVLQEVNKASLPSWLRSAEFLCLFFPSLQLLKSSPKHQHKD